MSIPLHRVERDAFATWLHGQVPLKTTVVGYARSLCNCPIAHYVLMLTGDRQAVLPSDAPPWMYTFIKTVDKKKLSTPITAEQALAYLANIP